MIRSLGALIVTLSLAPASAQDSQPASRPAPTSRPAPAASPSPAASGLAAEVAARHGGDAWSQLEAVRCRLRVEFGGKVRLEGTMLYAPHSNRVRLDLDDGAVLVFDGQRAWCAPQAFPRARFHLLTWSYFLGAPFKLGDPGSALADAGRHPLRPDAAPLRVGRLTFGAGVGDTPDDWYVDDEGTLHALGYIVTYGKSATEASKEPHAAVYDDYTVVAGLRLSQRWTFYNWTRAAGLQGEPIGRVQVSKLEVVEPAADAFAQPQGAVEDALPE